MLASSDFEWSADPGAYETQLMRRCNNPLFPPDQQKVSTDELIEARKIDDADFDMARRRLAYLMEDMQALSSGHCH